MEMESKKDLIVTIVKRGRSEVVVSSSVEAGATGGTIIFGRGTGIHERQKILGISVEPEKEIVFTVVDAEATDRIVDAIVKGAELETPCMGILFVIPLSQVKGIVHLLQCEEKEHEHDEECECHEDEE